MKDGAAENSGLRLEESRVHHICCNVETKIKRGLKASKAHHCGGQTRIMACHLVDLSAELQLKIVEELLQHPIAKPADGDVKQEDHDTRCRDSLLNWSCTSLFFRDLLAPYIFRCVNLRNSDKCGSSLLEVVKGRHNNLVKEIRFVGSAPGDAHIGEEAYEDVVAILPDSVKKVLSDLQVFPSLELLSVRFDNQFDDYAEWDEGLNIGEEEESDEDVKQAEEKIAWRALMAKTYAALLQNESFTLKGFEINDLVRKKVSTLSNPAFHAFLGRIERFHLSIYGEDNGAGWLINTHYYYEAMMSKLDKYLFDHLASITTLVLKAPKEGPIGLEGMNHVRLALKKGQMPHLKTLELEYIFVCQELIDFLLDHTQTLEHLSMHKCSSSINGLAHNGIPWHRLFNSLADAKPEQLTHLEISFKSVPLTYEESFGHDENEDEVPAEVKEAREILRNDPSRRIFAHINLDDKYGMLFDDDEENLASFQRGEDQASYERLMRIVNANAARRQGVVKLD